MSKFFASDHLSESGESSQYASESEDIVLSRVQTLGSQHESEVETSDVFSPASAPASSHTQGLLHSLLEERSMQQAMRELQSKDVDGINSIHHPAVQALGHEIYRRLARSLGNLGVTKQGFDSPHYSPIRKNYLEALDLLSHQNSTPTRPQMQKAVSQFDMAIPAALRNHVAPAYDLQVVNQELHHLTMAEGCKIGMPVHSLLDEYKYWRDFEEKNVLGKGGYGVVFTVRHKLDGCFYAIKKIPIGESRIRRIQENSQAEMDEIIRELRTLARLHHPNVVRYQTGWIGHASFTMMQQPTAQANPRKLIEAPTNSTSYGRAEASTEDDTHSGSDENFSLSASRTMHSQSHEFSDHGIVFEFDSSDGRGTAPVDTDSMRTHTVSLQRNERTLEKCYSQSGFDTEGGGSTLKPCLALHIQMSLYSMTLQDFLSPKDSIDLNSSTPASLRHCFHPSASLTILLSIIEGVRYLHREGIVHRDLKPGNVFLAIRPGMDCPPGAVDLSACTTCTETATRRYFNTDVCIGDLGLVSAIATAEDKTPTTLDRIVGTKTYRPEDVVNTNHPRLDVFALGIITFELFWKFGATEMERSNTLRELKSGKFPNDFDKEVECAGLQEFITSMVSSSEQYWPSWEDLKVGAQRLREGAI